MKTKKHILIVEDEAPLAKALQYKLQTAGYRVTIAQNGKMALDVIKKNTYDLILLDLVMPVLDGFGVLESLKKEQNQMPVIVLSNLGQESDVENAKALGAKDFYIKADTQMHDLAQKVSSFLSV